MTSLDTPIQVTVPAPHDVIVAWPQQPGQLFLLLHDAGESPTAMRPMAQQLADRFAHGIVACIAAPQAGDEGTGFQWYSHRGEDDSTRPERVDKARIELEATVRAWQQHCGLDASRTAVIAMGQAATVALEAVSRDPQLAARLFAIGGRFVSLPDAMHLHTSVHWLHGKDDPVVPYQAAVEAGYHLRQLDADFSVDVFPETGRELNAEMQARILHLLQNHVPLRMWREALAQQQEAEAPPPEAPPSATRH